MKGKWLSVEQIVALLKQVELGLPVADAIRRVGIPEQTFYRWKKRYAGLQSEQVREFKQLSEENATAEETGYGAEPGQGSAAGMFCQKSVPRPAVMKEVVRYVTACHGMPACHAF
jgi:hypothetical protein